MSLFQRDYFQKHRIETQPPNSSNLSKDIHSLSESGRILGEQILTYLIL